MVILCIMIFFSRIIDVSLGTVRTIMTVRGKRSVAAIIGFIEVMVWFLVVREALNTDETSIFVAISFAGGYAAGTIIGGLIVKIFIPTNMIVNVITSKRDDMLLEAISDAGFPMTIADVYGRERLAEKYMLMIYIDGKYLEKLKQTILAFDNGAFISVSEGKISFNGRIKPYEKDK